MMGVLKMMSKGFEESEGRGLGTYRTAYSQQTQSKR